MQELVYQVSFVTPAFLGNAEQQAQWRTPPFKALLRQWWRVVKAPQAGYRWQRLLEEERCLFGAACEDGKPWGRSQVQLRLDSPDSESLAWAAGTLKELPRMQRHEHPEVRNRQTGSPIAVASDVYLGYGPVTTQGLKANAIAPLTVFRKLRVRCPDVAGPSIADAMQLAAWFGTVGSRSRNGWGSLRLDNDRICGFAKMTDAALSSLAPTRSLADTLHEEWPHAIAHTDDERPAVWRVGRFVANDKAQRVFDGFDSWRQAMEQLARIKIGLRTQFPFSRGEPHPQVEQRHVLAYPVTRHQLAGGNGSRLANSLRFKIAQHSERFFGVIAHLPTRMPAQMFRDLRVQPPTIEFQTEVWRQVHQSLDEKFKDNVVRIRKAQP